jgi:anti-sigma factor RsiW
MGRRRHPAPLELSRYLEGDLTARDRRTLEGHLLDCDGCRRMLRSLGNTVRALGSLPAPSAAGLAEKIISALRAGEPGQSTPELLSAEAGVRPWWRRRVAERLVLAGSRTPRRWMRVTFPIAIVLGVALSLVNQGGMLLSGDIDLRMCVICALNFLLPLAALNLLLLAVASWAGSRS